MTTDDDTLAFYDREATAYADLTKDDADSPELTRFAGMVARGGHVLDFGCGPGWAADRFRSLGFQVSAIDGSPGLVDQANQRFDLGARVVRFADFSDADAYDGIWASFCLLHDSRAAMPDHLARLHRALRPQGALYIGLKRGTGERRDRLGRFYTYFDWPEMQALLGAAGFCDLDHLTGEALGMDGEMAQTLHLFARRD